MGVPGMVSFFKTVLRKRAIGYELKDTTLLIDSGIIYWKFQNLVKTTRSDKFGTNIIEFAKYWAHFFGVLDKLKVRPIIVYDGIHTPDKFGDVSSKHRFMMKSLNVRLSKLIRYQFRLNDTCMPDLAHNVFRSIVVERGYEIVQCYHETYPVLKTMAERYNCPILGNHSDFLLTKFDQPYLWNDWFEVTDEGIKCEALYHRDLCSEIDMPIEHNNLLTILYIILRGDFFSEYERIIRAAIPSLVGKNRDRFTTSVAWIREQFRRNPNVSVPELGILINTSRPSTAFHSEFEQLYRSYAQYIDTRTELGIMPLYEATTLSSSTAQFWFPLALAQRHHYRSPIEYVDTVRCSHSMMDRAKEIASGLLTLHQRTNSMAQSQGNNVSRVIYRISTSINSRRIEPMIEPSFQDALSQSNHEIHSKVMNFAFLESTDLRPWQDLKQRLSDAYLNEWFSGQSAAMMVCMKFALKYCVRDDDKFINIRDNHKKEFIDAVWSSLLFHAYNQGFLRSTVADNDSDIRVMVNFIKGKQWENQFRHKMGEDVVFFLKIKHFIELLNASLSTYMELSGFLKDPICKLELNKYYNACLIFNLMEAFLARVNASKGLMTAPEFIQDWITR